MATEDKGAGPQICQPVLYNNGGTVVAAMIYAVAAAGTVSLVYFNASGATSVTGVGYNPNLATGTWAYPAFI
jgi:hypothetical protein